MTQPASTSTELAVRTPAPPPPGPGVLTRVRGWLTGDLSHLGLTHIWCTGCGRDLDWAQPEFVEAHPAPLCAWCRVLIAAGELERAAVVFPAIETSTGG